MNQPIFKRLLLLIAASDAKGTLVLNVCIELDGITGLVHEIGDVQWAD